MSVNRKVLVEKLELVAPAANPGSFVPDFQNVHFNGEILATSDGIVSIFADNPLLEVQDGRKTQVPSFSVPADAFLNLLQTLDTEEISLEIKNENLVVKTKKIEGKFKIGKAMDCPIASSKESISTGIENLVEGLRMCRFGVCKEKTSGTISGVRIDFSKVYSTDRWRAYRYDLGISSGLSPVTVPTKFIDIVLRNQERIESFGINELDKFYVLLKNNTLIETSVYPGDFPPVESYFENVNMDGFLELIFEAELKDILEKHLKTHLDRTDFFNREIRISVKGKICTLFSESKNKGELIEGTELKEEVGEFEFLVNPSLLQEVLQHSKGKFLYHPEVNLILICADRLQVLIQTKE